MLVMKKNIAIYIYVTLLVSTCFFINSNIQLIFLVIASFFAIISMYLAFGFNDKILIFISFLIVFLNLILIKFSYDSAINLGFNNGIIRGNIGSYTYFDISNYYLESSYLAEIWNLGQFKSWLSGEINSIYGYYGLYNFFVVLVACLKVIFGENINVLIILKLQLSIISIFLLYGICRQFLNRRNSSIAVLIFNLFPGYLLVNISLMRDNIITFFVLLSFYIFLKNYENFKKNIIISLLFLLGIITYMKVYTGVMVLILFLSFYCIQKNIIRKLNLKKIILVLISLILVLIVLGKVIEQMGYGFLGSDLVLNSNKYLNRFDSSKVETLPRLIFWSIYNMFLVGKTTIEYKGYIGNLLNSISNIFTSIISIISIMGFLICNKIGYEKYKSIYWSGMIYSFISCFIITFIFSSIIPRLYINWIWIQIILLLKLFEYKCSKVELLGIFKCIIPILISVIFLYLSK